MHPASRTLPVMLLSAVLAAAAHAQPGIGTCVMGETRGASVGEDGLYHYGPLIYQWIDPGTCGFCLVSEGAIVIRTVELDVFQALHQTVPVDIQASVSVVGWKGTSACPEPDDAVILLPARSVTFTVTPVPLGESLVRVPIPDSPQFLQPAFLRLEFPPIPMPPATEAPALGQTLTLPCTSCRQYQDVRYLPGLHDACSGGSYYPFIVRARGDCVAVTAARSVSWGRVKAFYR
jgi:hypothetical protein